MWNPKAHEKATNPKANGSLVAGGAERARAQPPKGEGMATKRSGSEATRKTPRAGALSPAPPKGRKGKKDKKNIYRRREAATTTMEDNHKRQTTAPPAGEKSTAWKEGTPRTRGEAFQTEPPASVRKDGR